MVLEELGNYEEALISYDMAIEIKPDYTYREKREQILRSYKKKK